MIDTFFLIENRLIALKAEIERKNSDFYSIEFAKSRSDIHISLGLIFYLKGIVNDKIKLGRQLNSFDLGCSFQNRSGTLKFDELFFQVVFENSSEIDEYIIESDEQKVYPFDKIGQQKIVETYDIFIEEFIDKIVGILNSPDSWYSE